MKRLKFPGLLIFAATVLFMTSCGDGGTEEKTEKDTTTAETTSTPAAPEVVNTIVTTPQSMMTATHKVSNFAKWKASYDEHDSMRLANGIHNYVIGRGVQDTNMVLVAVKVDDMAKAKAFAKDPSLKKAMQKGGVTGAPTFGFATMVWQDTAMLGPDVIRSRTTFDVKDWDVWQKSFTEGKQERIDNGIVDRSYGYDPDNNKKVYLVTAVTDTAKAFAYYKSDALKQRRAAGGVIGEPKRFLFKIAKRY
jgi:hypothetical protein